MLSDQQFNEYLESIGGLVNAYTLKPITDCGAFSVGPGWYSLLKDCIEECIAAGWDKEISQVKEKLGTIRFYTGATSQEVHDIIRKYENQSARTCEKCGEPGTIESSGGWLSCVCEDHKTK